MREGSNFPTETGFAHRSLSGGRIRRREEVPGRRGQQAQRWRADGGRRDAVRSLEVVEWNHLEGDWAVFNFWDPRGQQLNSRGGGTDPWISGRSSGSPVAFNF